MMAWQTSSTVAPLPIGFVSASFYITDVFSSSVNPAILYILVLRYDDDTQLTLTLYLANSMAADFDKLSNPAFDIQYEIKPG
jgi:hypothetical protein